jgi:hypothetical protein
MLLPSIQLVTLRRMTTSKTIFVISALCAVLSVVAAQGASAASQTPYTCHGGVGTPTGPNLYSDPHCKVVSNPSGSFYHEGFNEQTEGTGSNNTTEEVTEPVILSATIGGLGTTIQAKVAMAPLTLEPNVTPTEEMFAEIRASKISFSGVSVTNRTCEFVGVNPGGTETTGSVETQPIVGTTKGQAIGVVKFEPQAGASSKWAEFKLTGESCPAALKGSYPLFGTVLSNPAEGATLPFTHTTVTGEPAPKLRLKNATTGPIAGLAGTLTLKSGKTGVAETFWHPIAIT